MQLSATDNLDTEPGGSAPGATNGLAQTRDSIVEVYGPQLGELAWHTIHADGRLAEVSEQHAASILLAAQHCQCPPAATAVRILEIGAYAHYGAHRAAATLGGASASHDISPVSLRLGLHQAGAAGVDVRATLVAGDFHDLPFSTGYFDIVFCASSVHHTFQPWRVLREMLRVLRPGGVLRLENEPVGRALCFYGFRGNRAENFTPLEAELAERGLMYTVSSPFFGSRPEMLFGMTENDRIPLDMFMDVLTGEGEFASLQLTPQIGEFEQRILQLPRDADLEASLTSLLLSEVRSVRVALTRRDQLLGVRLPETDDVWLLSYQIAPRLRRLNELTGVEADRETARLFGAALQATLVKHGNGVTATEMFRRPLSMHEGVLDDLPSLPGIRLHLSSQPIPAIEQGDRAALATVYPGTDWQYDCSANGLSSMLNLASRCRIVLPDEDRISLLLLRLYVVAASEPYKVILRSNGAAEIATATVVSSESLLFRELLPAHCTELFVETRALDDSLVTYPLHFRISVCRLIPVEMAHP